MEIRGFKGWFVRNFINPEDFMKNSTHDPVSGGKIRIEADCRRA
jgi:hypothetical protein